MLDLLKINNVALIDKMSVDFSKGFNVLIGETGAGKSIIIDALSFVLGEKLDKDLLRYGESQMRVDAQFSSFSNNKQLSDVLCDLGVEIDEDVLILSRTYNINGKSDCRVNGNIVSASMLKQISSCLVDIYGQHDNQTLLKDKNHMSILDSYDEKNVKPIKEDISCLLSNLKEIDNKILSIGGTKDERERTLELLTYQIEEIQNASIKEGEEEELKLKISRLNNAEKISQSLSESINLLQESSFSSLENIKSAIRNLITVSHIDDDVKTNENRLVDLQYELEDIVETLKTIEKSLVYNSNEIEALDSRLDTIKLIKKKYGYSLDDVKMFLSKAIEEKENLVHSEEILEKLTIEKNNVRNRLFSTCIKLSDKRKIMAKEIESKVIKELGDLGMKSTTFKIDFGEEIHVLTSDTKFTSNGLDNVSFLFSANAGQQLKSLSKTISGGEMSRFMLALKNVIRQSDSSQTVVFDEVDTGVSGVVAAMVGKKIARISKTMQVLCITHLPQVCAMANNVLFVSKQCVNGSTLSSIETLNEEGIINQIASMAGGIEPAEKAHSYAVELRELCQKFQEQDE